MLAGQNMEAHLAHHGTAEPSLTSSVLYLLFRWVSGCVWGVITLRDFARARWGGAARPLERQQAQQASEQRESPQAPQPEANKPASPLCTPDPSHPPPKETTKQACGAS